MDILNEYQKQKQIKNILDSSTNLSLRVRKKKKH